MYKAMDIADFVIKYANETENPISNLKLQKILYFIQADFLVNQGHECFVEDIEAWDFGPVVPSVYHAYKHYGGSYIPSSNASLFTNYNTYASSINENDKKRIINMIKACTGHSAAKLVEITHSQAPWKNVYKPYMNNVISKEMIADYFRE